MDKVSYALGLGIGNQLRQMGAGELNIDDFATAIKDVIAGNELKVSNTEAQKLVQDYFKKQEEKINAERAVKGKAAREAGEKYLAENAKKEGVVTLPSGVQYKVLKEGKGPVPADTSLVKIHYVGRTLDKDGEFDNSYSRKDPVPMRCNQAVKGFTEALTHMPEGSVWEVYIPQHLGYAEREMGKIKPFSVLIFKIELVQANAK